MSTDFAILQTDFLDELPERCNRIEERVLALERGAPDAFDELFYRQGHSLKGVGGMFGVPVITALGPPFESFIAEVRMHLGRQHAGKALAALRESGCRARWARRWGGARPEVALNDGASTVHPSTSSG